MRIRRTLVAVALLLPAPTAVLASVPAAASASAYSTVSQAYSASGTIPACRFSNATLQAALSQAPTYEAEYMADFSDAVQATMAAQTDGQCRSRKSLTALASRTPAPRPVRTDGSLPAAITTPTASAPPLPLLVGFVLTACCLLVALLLGGLRWLGRDPEFAQAARHSWAEAEYHAGAALERLRDRLRRTP